MQQTREILRKIRRLELQTRRLVNSSFAGQYHSVFKGSGMNFDEVREYAPGDEIRSIDWNVTARMNVTHIKKFTEERELTVMLLVDVSASGSFGSVHLSKRELGAEVASILAFSAIQNNDKVGLILFSDHVELFIPPKKGRLHILRLIRETLFFEPRGTGTNLAVAFETLNRVMHRQVVVFVLSDFIDTDFFKPFAVASRRHDIIAFPISDPAETLLPNIGIVTFEDAETGHQVDINTSDSRMVHRFIQHEEQRREKQQKKLQSYGVDIVPLRTDQDVLPPLRAFFERREKRLAMR